MNAATKPPSYSATLVPAAVPSHVPPPHGAYYVVDGQSPAHRARRRFFKAFVLVALGLFAWHLLKPSNRHRGPHGGWHDGDAPDVHADGTPCAGAQLHLTDDDVCADWAEYHLPTLGGAYPHAVRATFDLPLSSDRLFMMSQGVLSQGELSVVQGEDESDTVKVEVIAKYHSDSALARAKVCAMHRGDNDNGLGIITPKHRDWSWHHHDQLHFFVTVKLPGSSTSPLDVNHFDTDLHNFRHSFTAFEDSVTFKKLTVRGSNGAIDAHSLSVEHGTLKTSNAAIVGHFNSSRKLELITSNGIIDSIVDLHNAADDTPTALVVKTSNARVDADLRLHSTAHSKSSGGVFDVNVRNSNGPLAVYHATAPFDSLLTLEARTSNAKADIRLHPTFEGIFHGSTSNGQIVVDGPTLGVADPSGRGRKRESRVFQLKRTMDGSVYWGEEKARAGSVSVRTSNAPLALHL